MIGNYQELRSYSPYHDANIVRVSEFDDQGQEYWMHILDGAGKTYRERRERALRAIEQAMMDGRAPGQVRMPAPSPAAA